MNSAYVTSLCTGCTAAVPPPLSLPPGKDWTPPPFTHPHPSWMALAGALIPVALPPLLASFLLLSELLLRAAATAGDWIPPGWHKKGLQDTFPSHLPLHSCSSCLQLQMQPLCSSRATSCLSVLVSAPVWEVVSSMVMVLVPVEEGTQETSWPHLPWHLITCTSRGSR